MITETLNKAQVNALFDKEAILFGCDAVPEYRIAELFDTQVLAWEIGSDSKNSYLKDQEDVLWVDTLGPTYLRAFTRSGFYKIATMHNIFLNEKLHRASEGGLVVDALWKERIDRLNKLDAEAAADEL